METKRKSSTSDEEDGVKKYKTDENTLLSFSDCVLTCIMSYLNSYDLYSIGKTCTRFKYLIELRKLWKRIDVVEHPMCARKFKFFYDKINNSTEVLMLSGISPKQKTLTSIQFRDLPDNLTILSIERQYINSDEVKLCQFPKNLKELSLRGTHVTGKNQFLWDAHKQLVHLHTLILDDCKWVNEHSLMALSKLTSLENLSLYNCRNLNDSVAYMSVTARFGFTKLLRIDARYTPIGDQFLKCFHCIKTLREIYLESPPVNNNKRNTLTYLLFDRIKRYCKSNMQHPTVPNVVIFNQSTANNLFNRNRKDSKKKNETKSTTIDRHNCLDSYLDCTMDTCSPPGCGEFSEIMFSEDVSDSEEELLEYQMFHSNVSDSGVQWFCSSDPQGVDNQGEASYLFKKPLKKCMCEIAKKSAANADVPGPSGVGKSRDEEEAGPSTSHDPKPDKKDDPDEPRKPFGIQRRPQNWFQNHPRRRVVFKRKRLPDSSPESKRHCPDNKPSITVDLNIGEGPLHLEIINEISRQVPEAPQPENNQQDNNEGDSSSTEEDEGIVIPQIPPRIVPQPRREDEEHRNRDLRVIIERLDPGLHIVIDRAGRIQFGPVRENNYTKLKILMVRGYKMITDQALTSLTHLRLEMLDVTGTSVTENGIQQFLMVNPDCKVVHESICTCGEGK